MALPPWPMLVGLEGFPGKKGTKSFGPLLPIHISGRIRILEGPSQVGQVANLDPSATFLTDSAGERMPPTQASFVQLPHLLL